MMIGVWYSFLDVLWIDVWLHCGIFKWMMYAVCYVAIIHDWRQVEDDVGA